MITRLSQVNIRNTGTVADLIHHHKDHVRRWCRRPNWNIVLATVLYIGLYILVSCSSKCLAVSDAGAGAAGGGGTGYYKKNEYYRHENTPTSSTSSSSVSIRPPPKPPPPTAEKHNRYWDDEINRPPKEFDHHQNYYDPATQPHQQQRPPPPFPPPTHRMSTIDAKKGSSTLPSIHYSFPQHQNDNLASATDSDDTTAPQLPKLASARQDVATRYIMESYWNRCYLTLSAAMVGCAVTAFLGQSLLGHTPSIAVLVVTSILFAILTWLRNNIYGELIRAISLTIILSFRRSIQIRNQYPAHLYLYNAIMGDTTTNVKRRRRPFPPTNNPWTWSSDNNNSDTDDDNNVTIDFQMIPTVVAMAFIGSVIGTNIPLLPSSLGALLGAATLAYSTTLSSSRGDLCRCMGMRVVALAREFMTIANTDLHLPNKSAVVASAVLDKLLILDRQHSIRQRVGSGISALIDAVSRIQRDMQQAPVSSSSSSSGTDNVRSTSERPRRRPIYDDDKVRIDDESKPHRSQSRPNTYNDEKGNIPPRDMNASPSQPTGPVSGGGGWFSMFSGRGANDNDSTNKDEPYPYNDEDGDDEDSLYGTSWTDPSNDVSTRNRGFR